MEAHAVYDDAPRPGGWELAALVVLVVAGVGLPVLGWVIGMALVHLSDVWTARDKTIAMAGPAVVVALAVVATALAGDTDTIVLDLGPLAVLVLFGGGIAGVLGAAYLTWRAFALA
jgi:hypothetical protein